MRKLNFLMAFFFILMPFLLSGQNQVVKAITIVNVHSLGPQKLGNLSTVVTPINGQIGGRRSPPVSNAAYAPLQFWDGRAPSLEEQAKGPVENPVEMGNTHEFMIRSVQDIPGYVKEFEQVFGTSIVSIDMVAEAIAAFERTVVTTDSPFDRYVRGDEEALTKLEKKGLESLMVKAIAQLVTGEDISATGAFIILALNRPILLNRMKAGTPLQKIKLIWVHLRPLLFVM